MNNTRPALLSISIALTTLLTGCVSSQPKQINQENQQPAITNAADHSLTYVRTVEGIEEYQLENGLKVLFVQDQAQPKTLVNITYRVGSVNEYYGETGMAHLLEHMLFKGSTNYPKIDTEFQKRGMQTNATTWLDRTNYFGVFDANEETLAWTIGMEADRMVNATFTEAELKSEMTVVRNEMEKNENNPVRMLISRMSSMAHLWHNYGNSTIGARSDIENFPFAKLRAFYKKHYRPDNAVLTIAGRFDKEQTIKLIEQNFGVLEKPQQAIEPLYTQEPTQDGERIVNLRRSGDIPVIGLMYHLPSGLHPDAAAMTVLQVIMSDYTRGRLQKQLVESKLSTGAGAFSFMLKDSSQFIFIAQGAKGQATDEMEAKLLDIAENIKNNKVTDEEVKLAKLKLAKDSEQAMRNVTGIGMALSEYIAKGDYRHNFYFRDQIENVTTAQVQAAAEKYLIQSNRTLGRFIPTDEPKRAELPPAPDLNTLLKDYIGKATVSEGEVYDNTVANIKQRLVTTTWPEGTKLSIYPKKRRGEEILIKINLPTGNVNSLTNAGTAFDYIAPMLDLGNKKYSKEVISGKLDELKSSIDFSTDAGTFHINIKTDKKHLADTLTLLNDLLAYPTFPETELAVLKRSSIASIESNRKDPGSVALNNLRKALYNYPAGHPNEALSADEKINAIKKLTSKTLKNIYQKHLSITDGYIAVIGDVNSDDISQQLHAALKQFNLDTNYQKIQSQYHNKQGLNISAETPDKANAQLFIVNVLSMNKSHPDYLALTIANQMFGSDPFTSRIGARIRVKEGFSYSVGSGLQISEDEQQGIFYAQAIAAPENMASVITAYQEEVQKVVDTGFTQQELDNAIEGFINKHARQWAEDGRIAGVLIDSQKYQHDLDYYEEQLNAVKNLTLSEVNQAFIKHIADKKINVFTAGDFAKLAQ
ncbi:M16 family metallopeptidase [Thalassotalea agariperforans]